MEIKDATTDKVLSELKDAHELNESEMTEMGQLANRVKQQQKYEKKLEVIQEDELETLQEISQAFKQLEEHENQVRVFFKDLKTHDRQLNREKLLGFAQEMEEIIATMKIISEDIIELHRLIQKEESLHQREVEMDEDLEKLEKQMVKEFENHQELVQQVAFLHGDASGEEIREHLQEDIGTLESAYDKLQNVIKS